MAKNLRSKIPASDTLIVRDVNQESARRFVDEMRQEARNAGAGEDAWKVEVAESAREVADKSVSVHCLIIFTS